MQFRRNEYNTAATDTNLSQQSVAIMLHEVHGLQVRHNEMQFRRNRDNEAVCF